MDDPPRPGPLPTIAERALAHLAFVGLGRLVSAALSMLLVAAGCWWLLRAPPPPVERDLPFAAGASAATGSLDASVVSTTASSPGSSPSRPGQEATLVVQAAGAVAAPGVYTMPPGARVHELIAVAGGVTPDGDPSAIALAVVLRDGERIYVPRVGEVPPVTAGAAGAAPVGPVDLNRATAADLDSLPGIGPATASAIVEHRERSGPFASVDDLLDVPGIGPAKLEGLRELVTA